MTCQSSLTEALAGAGLDWIVPDWPAPPNVVAFSTTRNVARSVNASATPDPLEAELARWIPAAPVWLKQVHGAAIHDADSNAAFPDRPQADGIVTRARDRVCAIQTADCLPVLFTDRSGVVVAAAHAGWRGLAAGVIEAALAAMRVPPSDIVAWIGPGIGPRVYEVGADVLEAHRAHDPAAVECFEAVSAGKWLADLRGLAAGLTAAGFGAGSALTVIPIQSMIATGGYEAAFLYFGLGQGIVVCVISWFLRAPDPGEGDAASPVTVEPTKRQYTPLEMARSPIFWIMYLMFVLVGAGGLMATAQLAPIAKDFGVDTVPVSLAGITLPALTFALSLDRILNGITRPFFGWVSDKLGRENTMFIAFSLEALGIWLLSMFGEDPMTFVLLSGLVFFAWGEIYSLFPSTCTDAYGTRYATTNAGLLYTAKGTAALLVPWGNVLTTATGNWHAVFTIAVIMNVTAALLAIFVLKPMRAAHHAREKTRTALRRVNENCPRSASA